MKNTKTAETENAKITITLTREVVSQTNGLYDGGLETTKRKINDYYTVAIVSKVNSWSIIKQGNFGDFAFFSRPNNFGTFPQGAVARLGDGYIGQITYDICMQMMAELDAETPKTDEQIAIETAAAEKAARHEAWLQSDECKNAEKEAEFWAKFHREYDQGSY